MFDRGKLDAVKRTRPVGGVDEQLAFQKSLEDAEKASRNNGSSQPTHAEAAAERHHLNGPYALATLSNLDPMVLRSIRSHVSALLPPEPQTLGEMNLEKELVRQYNSLKLLQDINLHDSDVPLNQRAQAANALSSALGNLVKMQTDLRREETFKLLESALMEAVSTLPNDAKNLFFDRYEEVARQKGVET